jgi:hypothetical protein
MSTPFCSRLLVASIVVCALVVGAAPAASAQGFCVPDGLIGPCCAPVTPALPPFQTTSIPGLGICWAQCSVNTTNTLKVSWTTLAQGPCSEFTTTLTVADGGTGLPILTGPMVLDYTRTWNEIDPTGVTTQVWRFAAKADLSPVAGSPPACPVPSCIVPVGAQPTAFFYGYLDYAGCSATSGPNENALVLFHNCDRFIHMPGLSNRPGVFHPGQSYAIVAPHSAVQPFVPANAIAPGGPVLSEATRNLLLPGIPPTVCIAEDRVTQGVMQPLGAGCVCTMTANPKQQTLRQFFGNTACVNTAGIPGAWATINVGFPSLPWNHMVTTSIGFWANPGVYPGNERAWVDEGFFVTQDACSGDFIEMRYGGSTKGGFTVVMPLPVAVTNFTDLADNWTAPLAGPYPPPIMGTIQKTEHLLYVNEP